MSDVLYAYNISGNYRSIMPGWDLMDGEVAFDHHPTDEELLAVFPDFVPLSWQTYQRDVLYYTLPDTDKVAIRCFKAGIPFPVEWWDYVQALRLIVRTRLGDSTQPLPVRPEYPVGS